MNVSGMRVDFVDTVLRMMEYRATAIPWIGRIPNTDKGIGVTLGFGSLCLYGPSGLERAAPCVAKLAFSNATEHQHRRCSKFQTPCPRHSPSAVSLPRCSAYRDIRPKVLPGTLTAWFGVGKMRSINHSHGLTMDRKRAVFAAFKR